MNEFWREFPSINTEIEMIKNKMINEFHGSHPIVKQALTDFTLNEGKMLRSGLFVICSRSGKIDKDRLYRIGAAIEMLHMATLIHDDIIDNADTRRGKPSIHINYGKRNAVLIGDYLFSKSFLLTAEYADGKHIKMLSKVISSICGSELSQSSQLYRNSVTVRQYLRRIIGKTASLFTLCCYLGGLESGCSEEITRIMGKTGYYIGISFQIIDDILDFEGKNTLTGKPLYKDLTEGIYTLPLIYTLQKSGLKMLKLLERPPFSGRTVKKIIRAVNDFEGIEKSYELAEKYTLKAVNEINLLPDKEMKNILLSVTEKLFSRKK